MNLQNNTPAYTDLAVWWAYTTLTVLYNLNTRNAFYPCTDVLQQNSSRQLYWWHKACTIYSYWEENNIRLLLPASSLVSGRAKVSKETHIQNIAAAHWLALLARGIRRMFMIIWNTRQEYHSDIPPVWCHASYEISRNVSELQDKTAWLI